MRFNDKRVLVLLFIFCYGILFSQEKNYSDYYEIRKKYENFNENDSKAFEHLNHYIVKARKEKNYAQLVQGYRDAIFYSSLASNKLKYADSVIFASKLSKNDALMSEAYLTKGIVYYFHYKKYKPALDEYLSAYQYSKNTDDSFLKHSILYHIGVVKSYLGYSDEALIHFNETSAYFELKTKEKIHPNLIYNNKRGYYNSLHQMIVCNRNLQQYKDSDSLINLGISYTKDIKDYKQEYGYFLKEKGIEEYRNKEFKKSLLSLNQAVNSISHVNDFAWITTDYFYIGKSYLSMKDEKKAVLYFQKVDSIFQKHNFILPELRENYELLINQYKKLDDTEKELYYTKQLLKADKIISRDFTYLSSKIHKEYDTKALEEEKAKLERTTSFGIWIIAGLIFIAIVLFIIVIIKLRKEKEIKIQYKILEEKILNKNKETNDYSISNPVKEIVTYSVSGIDVNIVNDILAKLEKFERNNEFTKSGLTLNKLAAKFNTNSNYLSQVINENKGINFNRYLGELRINYITNKLYNDKKYLNYKIETLAEECGIASRTNFSNLFQEINGIRPTDFIKKRNEDLEKPNDLSMLDPI